MFLKFLKASYGHWIPTARGSECRLGGWIRGRVELKCRNRCSTRESCSLHETPRGTAEKSPSAPSILLLDSLKALSKPDGQGVEPVISLVAPGRGWDAAGGRWCLSLLSDSKSLLVSASDQKPRFISHWLQESYFKIFFLHYKTPLWERGWLKRPQSWFLCLLCI